jgi:hypothetical protein
MRTLAKPEMREECCSRLERLMPASQALWGRMTAHQMICHLSDSFGAAVGEKLVSAAPAAIPRSVIRWVALYAPMRWPKNVPTRPEIQQGMGGTPPEDWARDRQRLREWILGFPEQKRYGKHPMFGPMSWSDWQIWGYRHVDHHLRQFGV